MANRSLKRSIARHLMEMAGVRQINKKTHRRPPKPSKHQGPFDRPDTGRLVSAFSMQWKAYLDPTSPQRKALEAQLKREAVLKSRQSGMKIRAAWPVPR